MQKGEGPARPSADVPGDRNIDLDYLRHFAETEEEMREMISLFLSQSREIVETLKQSAPAGGKDWVEAAHKLKGGAAMFGAAKLCSLCEQAEATGEASAAERARTLADMLKAFFNVCGELGSL
jgi:HPt (histidine-containing phosphotransfer) domain-containing protein